MKNEEENIIPERSTDKIGRAQAYYSSDDFPEGYKKEKQHLEGLIFSLRKKLKDRRDQHFQKNTGHASVLTSVLQEFDKHFSIITKRHGDAL